ncbi:MAG: insulinase family protein [Candidatus Doudnabacteria bacterium]|nr:insulinase family protein [Candidatus Doudnabacteria bacterium]
MYIKKTLKNGLTLLKVPIIGAKSVLVDVFIKTGSRHEHKRINGISHFLEHLFFKGSKKYPTAHELSHALDAIGAEYNANTGKEHTQFYIKAAKKHLKFIFSTLTDVLQNPIFDPAAIEREKGVIMEEINMYQDTPMRHVEDLLEEVMWPHHPLGRNIAGTKKIIKRITRRDILSYVKTFYQPKNMIISVGGAFPDKVLDELVSRHWEGTLSKRFPAWVKARHVQKSPALKIETKKTEQCHLALGFRSYHHNHPDYIPQIVLATILGGGMSSRLFTEIRERRGWAYYVKAGATNYQDTGNFVIQAGVRLDAINQVIETLMAELKKIKNQAIPDRELTKAKEYLKGTLTLSLEASENLLSWYLEQVAFRKKMLAPEQAFDLIDKVSGQDVQRVAKDVFQSHKMNLAVICPRRNFSTTLLTRGLK